MRNKALACTADSIPYIKELRQLTGSVTAAILMQQLDYRFNAKPDGFYKFLAPCKNPLYKAGDSWTEELGFSEEEFRTAFRKIGLAHESKTTYDQAADAFIDETGKEYFYASYHDKIKGLTYYFRNDELVDAKIDELFTVKDAPETKNASPRKPTTPVYVNRESRLTETNNPGSEYKEAKNTTENTAERKTLPPAAPSLEKLEQLEKLIFQATRQQYVDERLDRSLKRATAAVYSIGATVEEVRAFVETREMPTPANYFVERFEQWRARAKGNPYNPKTHYSDGREKPKGIRGFVC